MSFCLLYAKIILTPVIFLNKYASPEYSVSVYKHFIFPSEYCSWQDGAFINFPIALRLQFLFPPDSIENNLAGECNPSP